MAVLFPRFAIFVVALCGLAVPLSASEADARAINANLQAKHLPFGTILDPIYALPTSSQIIGYTRCGDSALWTGAYLASEAFRYNVTGASDALVNLKGALAGLKSLVDVTGDNRLARCLVNASSPYAAGIASEEAANTIHPAAPYFWVDNTSRDEVIGAFFGLGAAYDLVNDAGVKSDISALTTRLLGFIAGHNWTPNDDISNTFQLRPEELQMLIQVGRHVNPSNGISGPFLTLPSGVGVQVDVLDNSSYFKFNLDYMTFYNLIRLQDSSDNRSNYATIRNYTASHQNAFFDVIDRAINGPNATRDAEFNTLLNQWLQRPQRDFSIDNTNSVAVCGSEACQPIPVPLRPPTDFLWQRDPFQLAGGGSGRTEGPGIDYLLPYWMGRYYGLIPSLSISSAAAPTSAVAPSSIASLYGLNLASFTASAGSQPLPATLGNITLSITDSAGVMQNLPLIYASPAQINFALPANVATGTASFAVTGNGATQTITSNVATVAPTLFSMNGAGFGVAAATAFSTPAANPQIQTPVPVFQCSSTGCSSVPINLGVDTPVYITFYGTGIRNRSSLSTVSLTINGIKLPVLYAGAAPGFTGLDQVNAALPLSLRASGETNVVLTVDGKNSNTVTINIQ